MRIGTTYGFVIIVGAQSVFILLLSSGWLTRLKCVILFSASLPALISILWGQLDSTPIRADATDSGLTVTCKSVASLWQPGPQF